MKNTVMKWLPVVLTVFALTACGDKDKAPAQTAGAGASPVGVITIQTEPMLVTTELPGRTSPFQVAEVRPQVSGIIKERLFKEGQDVAEGQVLYQIDPAVYQATYDSAVATMEKAQANLQTVQLKAQRYAELVNTKAVSQQEYDDAQAAFKQAQADLAAAKAAVDSAKINLDYTKVTSPIAGRVSKSNVTPGALVVANQATALTKVQQLDPIYVDVTQSSVDWLRLKRDYEKGILKTDVNKLAKVKLQLEDGSVYSHEGVLEFADVSVDETTGMISLRALFPNPKHDLLPGMYVRALLEEGVNENAITIPQKALQRNQAGDPFVYLVTPENKLVRQMITVDKAVGNRWLVSEGLKEGDKVAVEGYQNVRDPNAVVKPYGVKDELPPPTIVSKASPVKASHFIPTAKAAEMPAKKAVASGAKAAPSKAKAQASRVSHEVKVEAKREASVKPARSLDVGQTVKSAQKKELKTEAKSIVKAEKKAADKK